MTLDVEVPDPPSLNGPQSTEDYDAVVEPEDDPGDDYRREEIENFLEEGAWEDAFWEWADTTAITEEGFETAVRLGLIEQFDFYWDPATDEAGYRTPDVPDAAGAEFGNDDADLVEAELDSLGRTVSERLENDYLLRDDEDWGFFADEEGQDEFDSTDEP